jgi:hypothetical protein
MSSFIIFRDLRGDDFLIDENVLIDQQNVFEVEGKSEVVLLFTFQTSRFY